MEAFSALLVICAGNSPVPGELPTQRPVTRSSDVFFDLRLNKRLSETRETGDLRRHHPHNDVIVMLNTLTQSSVSWLTGTVQSRGFSATIMVPPWAGVTQRDLTPTRACQRMAAQLSHVSWLNANSFWLKQVLNRFERELYTEGYHIIVIWVKFRMDSLSKPWTKKIARNWLTLTSMAQCKTAVTPLLTHEHLYRWLRARLQ